MSQQKFSAEFPTKNAFLKPISTYDPPNQSLEPPLQDKNIFVKF